MRRYGSEIQQFLEKIKIQVDIVGNIDRVVAAAHETADDAEPDGFYRIYSSSCVPVILFRDSDIVKMLLQRSAWFRQDQLSACLNAAKALQAGLDAFVDRHDLVDQRFRRTDRDIIKGMQLLRRSLLEGSVRSQNRIGGKESG